MRLIDRFEFDCRQRGDEVGTKFLLSFPPFPLELPVVVCLSAVIRMEFPPALVHKVAARASLHEDHPHAAARAGGVNGNSPPALASIGAPDGPGLLLEEVRGGSPPSPGPSRLPERATHRTLLRVRRREHRARACGAACGFWHETLWRGLLAFVTCRRRPSPSRAWR